MKTFGYKNQVVCVIVLYKTRLEDCVCYNTIKECFDEEEYELTVVAYNNSVDIEIPQVDDCMVFNSGRNSMLASAYNYALLVAERLHKDWLLLLDQDTKLESKYGKALCAALKSFNDEDIVAFVPKLYSGDRLLSPVQNRSEQNVWWFQRTVQEPGCHDEYITAFNSGTLLSVEFMSSIGGFSERYPLDRLDYWYFYQIYKHRRKVYVLDTTLEHNLSVLDYEKNMTVDRYQMILKSELAFARETGRQSVMLYKLLVICRFLKQLLSNKKYAWLTFQQIWK